MFLSQKAHLKAHLKVDGYSVIALKFTRNIKFTRFIRIELWEELLKTVKAVKKNATFTNSVHVVVFLSNRGDNLSKLI